MKQLVVRFVREDAGQDLIEYVLLASFIAAGVITGATFLGSQLNGWYRRSVHGRRPRRARSDRRQHTHRRASSGAKAY